MSSVGDVVDRPLAEILKREVSDLIISHSCRGTIEHGPSLQPTFGAAGATRGALGSLDGSLSHVTGAS